MGSDTIGGEMRDIKFRAWDGKKMLHNVGVHPFIIQALWRDKDNQMKESDDGAYLISPEFIQYKLMQYTGLKDKNGKEIYEGDVLRFTGEYPMGLDSWMGRRFWERTGYVYYDDEESRFTCTKMGDQVSPSYWIACEKEVIGNIYENPELTAQPE